MAWAIPEKPIIPKQPHNVCILKLKVPPCVPGKWDDWLVTLAVPQSGLLPEVVSAPLWWVWAEAGKTTVPGCYEKGAGARTWIQMKKQTLAEVACTWRQKAQVQTLALPLTSCVLLDYLINILSLNSLICKIETLIPSSRGCCLGQTEYMQSDLQRAWHSVSIQESKTFLVELGL